MHHPDSNDRKLLQQASAIGLLALDVDGTLTDGCVYLNNHGDDMLAFHTHDGYGLKALMRAGIEVAAISGRNSAAARTRLEALGIKHLYLGVDDKLSVLQGLLNQLQLDISQTCYVGDDYIDLPVLQVVGLPCVVSDGHSELLKHVLIQTRKPGGYGAVREVVELILRAHNQLHQLMPPMPATKR